MTDTNAEADSCMTYNSPLQLRVASYAWYDQHTRVEAVTILVHEAAEHGRELNLSTCDQSFYMQPQRNPCGHLSMHAAVDSAPWSCL